MIYLFKLIKDKKMNIPKLSNNNQSIWLKMKSPFGQDQYIPRIIDITADHIQQYKQKSRRAKFCLFFLLTALLLLLLLCSILLPILLIKPKSPIIPVIITINCIYPNVETPMGRCVNILIDSNNCGSVGNVCPNNLSCSAGVCSNVPGIQLDKPITIWSSAINGSADDQMYNVTLPWYITLYNTTTNNVIVTSDGVLCLGGCSTSYTESSLPANVFPGATVFPYWDDLYIYPNTSQGIYYQSEGNSPNRKLIFEYYMSHYIEINQYYHFQLSFFENNPGVVQFKYFDATDQGDTCTIGVQASNNGPFIMYSYDQVNSVLTNMTLTFDTNQGIYYRS
ncbi:unnamed protein product [Rotaria sordida]|uniref:Uncharacterized protein n=1 Tax=Rotaria sordida TaxID=392033 RepID=A0A814HZG8_9BILA|nr:unnamed protein product [Rotaria sordida]